MQSIIDLTLHPAAGAVLCGPGLQQAQESTWSDHGSRRACRIAQAGGLHHGTAAGMLQVFPACQGCAEQAYQGPGDLDDVLTLHGRQEVVVDVRSW